MLVLEFIGRTVPLHATGVPVADAATDNQLQGVCQPQARHGVGAQLVGILGGIRRRRPPLRLRIGAIPLVEVTHRRTGQRSPTVGVQLLLAVHGADDHLVILAAKVERNGGGQIEGVLLAADVVPGRAGTHAQTCDLVRRAGQVQQTQIRLVGRPAVSPVQAHTGVKGMLQVGVVGGLRRGPLGPLRGGGLGAAPVGARAIAEPGWQAAPHGRGRAVLLVAGAQVQQRAVGQVDTQGAQQDFLLVLRQVNVGVLFQITAHHASANPAAVMQGARYVQRALVTIPGAHLPADKPARLHTVSALAHHVDGGRRVACAGDQPGGATHHFHAVIQQSIHLRLARSPASAPGGRHAVDHQIGDIKAPGREAVARAVEGLAGNPGGHVDHVGNRLHREVVHHLAGDHRHRLRCLARRQGKTGRGARRLGSVGAGAFGYRRSARRFSGYRDRFQLDALLFCCSI